MEKNQGPFLISCTLVTAVPETALLSANDLETLTKCVNGYLPLPCANNMSSKLRPKPHQQLARQAEWMRSQNSEPLSKFISFPPETEQLEVFCLLF